MKLLDVSHGASSGAALTLEGQAFADSKPRISQFPEGKRPPEYTELGNFPHPFMPRISAREMAKLIAFLKGNGGYSLITTQELGNCMWASVLRGTDVKKEFASMHLRRLVVMMIGAYPKFFFNYLKYSLASTYGQDRPQKKKSPGRRRRALSPVNRPMTTGCQGPSHLQNMCSTSLQMEPGEMTMCSPWSLSSGRLRLTS